MSVASVGTTAGGQAQKPLGRSSYDGRGVGRRTGWAAQPERKGCQLKLTLAHTCKLPAIPVILQRHASAGLIGSPQELVDQLVPVSSSPGSFTIFPGAQIEEVI